MSIYYLVLLVAITGYHGLEPKWTTDRYDEYNGWVSCGCHKAPSCKECGTHPQMCNGDCIWNGSSCCLKDTTTITTTSTTTTTLTSTSTTNTTTITTTSTTTTTLTSTSTTSKEDQPALARFPKCYRFRFTCYDNGYLGEFSYQGIKSTTRSGKKCQNWMKQIPHKHNRTQENFPDSGLGDHNYCRNPKIGSDTISPWCYTTDINTRWETCAIYTCSGYTALDSSYDYDYSLKQECLFPYLSNGIARYEPILKLNRQGTNGLDGKMRQDCEPVDDPEILDFTTTPYYDAKIRELTTVPYDFYGWCPVSLETDGSWGTTGNVLTETFPIPFWCAFTSAGCGIVNAYPKCCKILQFVCGCTLKGSSGCTCTKS